MAKKAYAVTNIKVGPDKIYPAGAELDTEELKSVLSMDQIKQLLDDGAIEIRETAETETPEEGTAPEGTVVNKAPETPAETAPESDTHGDQPK